MLTFPGVPWPEIEALSLSFAPDGTIAGDQSSQLFATLGSQQPTSAWELEILQAFQTWAVVSNINIRLVPDGGQPFGTLGLKQGDPRFGDVRVGAISMASDVLAVATPYDPFVANTWVGDVFLNSSYQFGPAGSSQANDLYSVLLHEAGHVLGMGHSLDPNSPMFELLNRVHEGLTADDIATLQSVYGARNPDGFDAAGSNDTLNTASPLDLLADDGLPDGADVDADLTTLSDADIYQVVVRDGVTGMTFQVDAAQVSLLVPRLTVLNSAGEVVAVSQAIDPLHNSVALTVDHATPGEKYYVKVDTARDDVFGIGRYALHVDPRLDAVTAARVAAETPAGTPAAGAGDSSGPEFYNFQLLATKPGYVEHTYYEADGSLSLAMPVQTYRVRSADLGPDMTNVMTVVLQQESDSAALLDVAVYDDQGQRVATELVTDSDGSLVIRVPSVRSNADYFVQVTSSNLGRRSANFEVTADFARDATYLTSFVQEDLNQEQREVTRTLQVNQSQQFHFVLSATDWNALVETGVNMAIVDGQGKTIFTMSVADGATRSADLFLNQGTYTFRFSTAVANSMAPLRFQLNGIGLSDPLGPQLRDTTLRPLDSQETVAAQLLFYWLPVDARVAATNLSAATPLVPPVNLSQQSVSNVAPGSQALPSGFGGLNIPILGPTTAFSDPRPDLSDVWYTASFSSLIGRDKSRYDPTALTTLAAWPDSPPVVTPEPLIGLQPSTSHYCLHPELLAAVTNLDASFFLMSQVTALGSEEDRLGAMDDTAMPAVPPADGFESSLSRSADTRDHTYWIIGWYVIALGWLAANSRQTQIVKGRSQLPSRRRVTSRIRSSGLVPDEQHSL
ncbi:MAG: Matrixin [Planctomycetaceae bacterium]|nr:Matrixin [Planctomycetaceae bacterium]